MNDDAVAKSMAMLTAFLSGATYTLIARQAGITSSAVEQKIKALARDLQRVVGVVDVAEDDVPTAAFLRLHKDSYLEALEHYRPAQARRVRKNGGIVTDQEIGQLVQKTWETSNCRQRDVALLLILFSTAARPLEIARLEVRDYLHADGTVREESVMRADAAIGGRARPLYFASAKTNAAIDAYLNERARLGYGVHQLPAYRGLRPTSRLFLKDDGNEMTIRIKEDGRRKQHFCGTILNIYRKLFATAGLHGVSALSARRTAAHKLKQRGAPNKDIGMVLGLRETDSIRNLLGPPVATASVSGDAALLKARVRELV